ncbi:MAG: flagellar basal body P-ring protein FlgI [Steroidobacteraceae bacterium]|jgi:flagellar P-ring protein precursor FlgI
MVAVLKRPPRAARSMALRAVMFGALLATSAVHAERVKDLASIGGVRNNQLVGYGLVVGLDGTGDQTSQAPYTAQSIKNMLARFGVSLPPGVNAQPKNVAAVTVHADLPPFTKAGQNIDVTVASIGNAGSLRGGLLLMTPLRGADGEVYAVAQGNLVVGGFGASGRDGSRIAVNIPSAGRIPGGASVEREVSSDFASLPYISLDLRAPDFTTAMRLADGVNRLLGEGTAEPIDAVSVRVAAPKDLTQRIAWMSTLEQLEITPGDAPARVIVNSRTGTVVMNAKVRVLPAAVTHGSMSVTITERIEVSQPGVLSNGTTVQVPRSEIELKTPDARMFKFDAGVTLDTIVDAVNRVGAAPGDLVAILEALKQAGALRAELIVI